MDSAYVESSVRLCLFSINHLMEIYEVSTVSLSHSLFLTLGELLSEKEETTIRNVIHIVYNTSKKQIEDK